MMQEKQSDKDSRLLSSGMDLPEGLLHFSHEAMHTVFEVFIYHPDPDYAENAAYEAFDRLDGIELELSRFIENSDISQINNLPVGQPLKVSPCAFEALELCIELCRQTEGAFDVTFYSLIDVPSEKLKAKSHYLKRIDLLELNPAEFTVKRLADNIRIDMGGFGKGYGVDKMAEVLRDWGITSALIHGGTSSALAIGSPPGVKGWPVTFSHPQNLKRTLARIDLLNMAISGSGLEKGGHIIDPVTAKPIKNKIAAWSLTSTAATADALSTAFMIMSPDRIKSYCKSHPDTSGMLILRQQGDSGAQERIIQFGSWKDTEISI